MQVKLPMTLLCCMQDLAARYGKPIIVLNLVKSAEKRPRESILQAELARAIAYINKGVGTLFCSLTAEIRCNRSPFQHAQLL